MVINNLLGKKVVMKNCGQATLFCIINDRSRPSVSKLLPYSVRKYNNKLIKYKEAWRKSTTTTTAKSEHDFPPLRQCILEGGPLIYISREYSLYSPQYSNSGKSGILARF